MTDQTPTLPPPSTPEAPVKRSWLKRKAGPLPVWAWIVGAIVGLVVYAGMTAPPKDKEASADAPASNAAPSNATTPSTASTVPASTIAPATPSQQQALKSAVSYLNTMAFSRQGLIDQLSSEYGGQFSVDDATWAVDHVTVDWNEQAAKSAQEYLATMPFSCQALIEQLASPHGGKFTQEQAMAGAATTGIC